MSKQATPTTLNVIIATHRREGIERVANMNLPYVDNVSYVVSWQNHENAPIPSALHRDDVEIHRYDGVGLSNNRNNAMEFCTADLVLIADDDIRYSEEQIGDVIRCFDTHPDVDFATFTAAMHGRPHYPDKSCRLLEPLPKGYWVPSFTIAFRRVKVNGLRFHPLLGLGAPKLHGAEDEFFLLSAIRRGLNCCFFPVEICSHPSESTGTKGAMTAGNLNGFGCYIALAYRYTWPARLIVKAMRLAKNNNCNFIQSLRHLYVGAFHAPKILHSDKCYRW